MCPTYKGPYSPDYSENPTNCDQNNSYYPGPTPGKFVSNTAGKNSVDWSSRIDDVYAHPDGTDPAWHVKGGFSGPINKTGPGFGGNSRPAGNHPRHGTDATQRDPFAGRVTKAFGVNSGDDPNQGSPRGAGFKWK
jgi:hypothetical protein